MSDIENYDFEKIRDALPQNDKDAEDRYNIYKSKDPFPDIAPALLNSADFIDYVITTGMIYPFYPEKAKLKPASYAVSFEGEYQYWDENNNVKSGYIENGDIFKFKKNTLTYITLEPYFRIPDYIALRFNFKISMVYKGLLLGTGPLVDPGFEGKLHIPIHNLTGWEYHIKGGEDLLYFEFTKLSPINGKSENEKRKGVFVRLPKQKYKERKALKDYLYLANQGNPIVSSMQEVISIAEKTKKSIDTIYKIFSVALVTLLLTFGAILYQGLSLVKSTNVFIREEQARQLTIENDFKKEIIALENRIDSLTVIIEQNIKDDKNLKNENKKN